jgi:hypothetical protein
VPDVSGEHPTVERTAGEVPLPRELDTLERRDAAGVERVELVDLLAAVLQGWRS